MMLKSCINLSLGLGVTGEIEVALANDFEDTSERYTPTRMGDISSKRKEYSNSTIPVKQIYWKLLQDLENRSTSCVVPASTQMVVAAGIPNEIEGVAVTDTPLHGQVREKMLVEVEAMDVKAMDAAVQTLMAMHSQEQDTCILPLEPQ